MAKLGFSQAVLSLCHSSHPLGLAAPPMRHRLYILFIFHISLENLVQYLRKIYLEFVQN